VKPMPLPRGLQRKSLSFRVNEAERLAIEHRASAAHQTTTNYIRTKLGLPARPPGRPLREQMEREMEEAWDLLREAGHDPTALVPEGDWLDE